MKDIRITQGSDGQWDLKMENGKLVWAEEGTEAAQHAFLRLMIFKGELGLNGALTTKVSLGTKWYETIFDMSKSKAEKELEMKRRILGTTGVKSITKWTWTQAAHTVTIDAIIMTDWGEIDVSQTIEAL